MLVLSVLYATLWDDKVAYWLRDSAIYMKRNS